MRSDEERRKAHKAHESDELVLGPVFNNIGLHLCEICFQKNDRKAHGEPFCSACEFDEEPQK